jgi:hypothetical protein
MREHACARARAHTNTHTLTDRAELVGVQTPPSVVTLLMMTVAPAVQSQSCAQQQELGAGLQQPSASCMGWGVRSAVAPAQGGGTFAAGGCHGCPSGPLLYCVQEHKGKGRGVLWWHAYGARCGAAGATAPNHGCHGRRQGATFAAALLFCNSHGPMDPVAAGWTARRPCGMNAAPERTGTPCKGRCDGWPRRGKTRCRSALSFVFDVLSLLACGWCTSPPPATVPPPHAMLSANAHVHAGKGSTGRQGRGILTGVVMQVGWVV